jgi:GT2 family glycosyltransferase
MNKEQKIFIVIVNYNGGKNLLECLKSVYASHYKNFEVVVVDNASNDGSIEEVRPHFSKVHYIMNGKNSGFAGGVNLGIRFALEKMADLIFLLNNDAILEPETITSLEKEERKYGSGIFSPRITSMDGKNWFSSGKVLWWRMRAIHQERKKNISKTYKSEYVPGCAMLISKKVFGATGIFDENFFLYYEDVDFCLRAKQYGYLSYVCADVNVKHKEESESNLSKKTYFLVRSALYFFSKHASWEKKIWYGCFTIIRRMTSAIRYKKHKNDLSRAVYRALRSLSYE